MHGGKKPPFSCSSGATATAAAAAAKRSNGPLPAPHVGPVEWQRARPSTVRPDDSPMLAPADSDAASIAPPKDKWAIGQTGISGLFSQKPPASVAFEWAAAVGLMNIGPQRVGWAEECLCGRVVPLAGLPILAAWA
ncbi:hypothetical protein M433DRAFT_354885 [Acidomyces richmondensis BFW]|nr:MAG: hypothetical protein FE78DRAFT_382660 [Acidomyces sp. 'richmondensis']KYG43504.1 hypothetical protein M433DRAFT_354885 [Acidomyces richmondensis BFW]